MTQPFSLQSWLSRADLMLRLQELDDEIKLQQGDPLIRVPNKPEIELANRQSFFSPDYMKSPLFPPDTHQGRRHAELMRLIQDLERDIQADERVPPPPERLFTDIAGWLDFREKFPQDWEAYAARVRRIRRLYYAFWADNAATIAAAMDKYSRQLPPPDTWAEALSRAKSQGEWAHERLRRFENIAPEEHQWLVVQRARQQKAEALVPGLETVVREIRNRPPEAAFAPEEWTALYRLLDAQGTDKVLSDFWYQNYRVMRSEVAKQVYAGNPDALSPVVRRSLETEWTFDAEQATLQIGGTPRAWCAGFIENKPNSVMLLQFPTNNFTHFTCGDVDDLVVSISWSDLERHDFRKVWVDVSN
jgi:hypothetical protein